MLAKTLATIFALLLSAVTAQAGKIEAVEPELVRDDLAIRVPLYARGEGPGVTIGRFDSDFDHSQLLFDDLNVSGTKDKLVSTVKLGDVVSAEIELQARAMGIPAGENGWLVEGTVKDILVMNREIAFGPLLFYGHVSLALEVISPAGETTSVEWSFHPTAARFNAGFGAKDENREALAEIVVLASQQVVSRLNRDFIRLTASAAARADIETLGEYEPAHETVRRIGLAGEPSAIYPLLDLLGRTGDEYLRADAVQALGLLGVDESIERLKDRYAGEDEDVRYAILVALSQIGGESEFIAQRGLRDDSRAIRDLSGRLSGEHR